MSLIDPVFLTDANLPLTYIHSCDSYILYVLQDDNLCGDSLNKFYDNKSIQDKHKSPEFILIQGHRLKVLKVMAYKRKWLSRNWINPMHFYAEKFERIATQRNKPTNLVLGYGTISTTSDKQGSDDEKLFCDNSKKTNRCCMIL